MKSLSVSERYGWSRYVGHQVYYSLIGREYEWGADAPRPRPKSEASALIWSPLGWGRLTGKIGRNRPVPEVSRLHKTADVGPQVENEHLYKVVDAIRRSRKRHRQDRCLQIALNWLLQRPTVAFNVIMGARNEEQLRQNLASVGWNLTKAQIAKLDAASATQPVYPYWHQRQFAKRNPIPV